MTESKKIKQQKAKAEMKMRRGAGRRVMALAIGLIVCSAALVFAERAYNWRSPEIAARLKPPVLEPALQERTTTRSKLHSRLSLQPEANRMRRRLGQRYQSAGRERSLLVGTLTVERQSQPVTILRTQEDDGERVEIALGGGQASLGWSSAEGAKSQGDRATGDERKIIERLTLDSADQFILAQVRGASYYRVARDVRPSEAGNSDDYQGPVWDVVQLSEPERSGDARPQSGWRMYYINSETGLIERIESEQDGQLVTAELSEWAVFSGELAPGRIRWIVDGEVVMELSLNNVSHGSRQ